MDRDGGSVGGDALDSFRSFCAFEPCGSGRAIFRSREPFGMRGLKHCKEGRAVYFWAVIGFLQASLALAVLSCGSQGIIPDSSPLAISANDNTALIEISGCGYQPLVTSGYTYCRIPAGPVGNLSVTFVAPPQGLKCAPHVCPPGIAGCDPTSCTDFTVFFPDQSPAYSDSIPLGQSSKTVPWTTLVKKDTFDPQDTGFWLYTYTIRWTDPLGQAQRTISDGEIRLRVVNTQVCAPPAANGTPGKCASYVPLNNSPDDPAFVWSWLENNQTIRMTTAARTYVEYPGAP
jgi:hypothetical protein